MSILDEFKKAYEAQKVKQGPGAHKGARTAGIIFILFGLVFAGVDYYMWTQLDYTYIVLVAAALGFLGLGIYMAVTGKAPKPKR